MKLKIVGPVKCRFQYQYSTKTQAIDRSDLIGVGIHRNLVDEFRFSKYELPDGVSRNSINFRNGAITVRETKYIVDELNIGSIGISSWVWGETDIAKRVVDRTVEMIEASQPAHRLSNLPRKVNLRCRVKAKLDIDASKLFDGRLLRLVGELAEHMKASRFSISEIQFPMMAIAFVSRPDISALMAGTEPNQLEFELQSATGTRNATLWAETTEDYRENIFNFQFPGEIDTAKEFLSKLEKSLRSS